MSFLPKDLASDPDVTVLDDSTVMDKLKALIVQKLTDHFNENPGDHSINGWEDVTKVVIGRLGAAAKAKAQAINPKFWNKAFDQLVAEGLLVYRGPEEPAEELPDTTGL